MLGVAYHCWRCLSCLALLSFPGVASHAWRCLPCWRCFFSLALLGVACIAWCCLALLGFVGVAGFARHCSNLLRVACLAWRCLASATGFADSSCTLLVANALSVLLLAQWVCGWVGGVALIKLLGGSLALLTCDSQCRFFHVFSSTF